MAELTLKLFGEFELHGTANLRLPTRKAEGLLAYLAMSAGQTHRRGKLTDLLWGEKDERRGRHSLAQSLHVIRSALKANGDGPLIIDGGTVGIDPNGIELDVAEFERLAGQQTTEALTAAVDLYRGDLLDGIDIREAAFEDWVRGERSRLRAACVYALDTLLSYHLGTGDDMAAIDIANRLLMLDPIHEATHRTLMGLYHLAGRDEAAIRQYRLCEETLRRDLDIAPDEDTRSLYEELLARRTGLPQAQVERASDKPSIAVLAFDNLSDDPEQEYFSDGMTDDLITDLSKISGLLVIAQNSVFTYKGKNVKVQEIAKDLNVTHVLKGSVRRSGHSVRIVAQLIDGDTGTHLWAEKYTRDLEDIFAVQDEVAGKIIAALKVRFFRGEERRVSKIPSTSFAAYELYLKAKEAGRKLDPKGLKMAFRYLDQATAEDPNFVDAIADRAAYAAWVYGNNMLGVIPNMKTALKKAEQYITTALELDGAHPDALWAKAYLMVQERNYDDAIALLTKAIEDNPNSPQLFWAMVSAHRYQNSGEQAVQFTERALKLDPKPNNWNA